MKRIHARFDLFYRNRLSNEELKKIKNNWDPDFKPFVSELSRLLADHHRSRLLEETAMLIEN